MEAGLPPWRQKALPGEPTQQDRLPLHGPAPKANPSPISPSRCLWELQIKIKRVPTDVPLHPCHRQLRPRLEGGYYFTQSRVPREPVSCLERRGASRLESGPVRLTLPPTCCVTLASPSPSLGLFLPIPENQRSSWVSQNELEKGGWTVSDLCITSHCSMIPGIQEGSGPASVAR